MSFPFFNTSSLYYIHPNKQVHYFQTILSLLSFYATPPSLLAPFFLLLRLNLFVLENLV